MSRVVTPKKVVSNLNRVTPKSASQRTTTDAKSMQDEMHTGAERVKVVARFRPISDKSSSDSQDVVQFGPNGTSVALKTKSFRGTFTFDKVFPPGTGQSTVYNECVIDTVEGFLQGFNGTILAYGQTGSGKTYTMMGGTGESKGLIPRIGEYIFDRAGEAGADFDVSVSLLEIYNERLIDLLGHETANAPELKIIEDQALGIHVRGLTSCPVNGKDDMSRLINQGSLLRKVSSTKMNEESSRSHLIFQINLRQRIPDKGITKVSKLYLVDLAGSEKIDKTGVVGQGLEEAKKINLSLSSLGNVINALTDDNYTHVPYRESKLTRILQESLGGNSRTTLIIGCSPSSEDELETLSTLRFGARAKSIETHSHINQELTVEQLMKERVQDKLYIAELERSLNDANRFDESVVSLVSDLSDVSLKEQLDERNRDFEQMEDDKNQELIMLKLRVAELETTNESLLNDLRCQINDRIAYRMEMAHEGADQKAMLNLQQKHQKLAVKYQLLQNENNELQNTNRELQRAVSGQKRALQKHTALKHSQRIPRNGLNLKVMQPSLVSLQD